MAVNGYCDAVGDNHMGLTDMAGQDEGWWGECRERNERAGAIVRNQP